MKRFPVIDLGQCNDCESCMEVCPTVFKRNADTGQIEVLDLSEYPEECIDEAVSLCPADCITWEEMP